MTRFGLLSAACLIAGLALAGCELGQGNTNGNGGGGNVTVVEMRSGNVFSPITTTVAAGTTIRWRNADAVRHTATSDTGAFNSDTSFPNGLAQNETFDWQVPATATSGTRYYYNCRFHGTAGNGSAVGTGMVGVIVVQ